MNALRFEMQSNCKKIFKTIEFLLDENEHYFLQISSNASSSIEILVTINIEIKHLLVESDASSDNVSFAKFFKSAVENSDVIVYAGHSGLGDNLDIPYLESKAGPFVFNKRKRQLFFFDSCASYAYYLTPFSAEKTKAKIDVITTGLSSYFVFGQPVLEALMEILFDPKIEKISWIEVLTKMEKPQGQSTSLINVGGI